MTWLTGLTVLLVILCVSSAQDNEIIEVRYPQKKMTPARGSSVKLSCEANYDFSLCKLVHVVWLHLDKNKTELTDPSKYFTTVSETVPADNRRRRQVVTEIFDLTTEDNGQYQCKGVCVDVETAMGHFIWITVKD